MKHNRVVLAVASSLLITMLSSCSSSLSQPTERFSRATNYGDSKAVETLTNEFGSTDLQMIAETMVGSSCAP